MWFINPTSNDKYSFRQFFYFFSRRFSYLSFPSTSTFTLNACALHKVTQSSYQLVQICTCWYHQLFHFVLTCVESLSHFVAMHPLLNNGVNHQMIPYLFFQLGPSIKLSRQPNMCLSKPVPLTCNIFAGTDPSNPDFRSPKGTFSKALELFFLHIFLKPSPVKHACFNSSDVVREHIGMGLEISSKRHLQSP
jgi:hypothetical protein